MTLLYHNNVFNAKSDIFFMKNERADFRRKRLRISEITGDAIRSGLKAKQNIRSIETVIEYVENSKDVVLRVYGACGEGLLKRRLSLDEVEVGYGLVVEYLKMKQDRLDGNISGRPIYR